MKTRSFLEGPSNIAAIVKARRHPTDQDITSFSQIGNDPIITNNFLNPNQNNIESSNFVNVPSIIIPEKKVVTKTVWTVEDKILFFTALKNYGRNFNEISRFIKNRESRLNPKKNGKSKEQVRVFYNRTWNAIKQFIKFPPEIPQSIQELYALINYSVFRTRVKKVLNPRLGEKLNEMVINGSTWIKCNGKRVRLRTPVCPALKRLNNLQTPEQEYTIPDDITIELVPRNYVTLWRVQQIEQNPRMRLKVAVNRQLSDVVNFLSTKLKSAAQLIRETLTLPAIEPPKLHIRLSEDARFFREIAVHEMTKPRCDSITFRSYCENILKQPAPVLTRKSSNHQYVDRDQEQCTNNDPKIRFKVETENESTFIKIDYNDMQRKLTAGVGIEDAKDIKILALYIGLGCPAVIRFLYEYLHPSDMDSAENSVSNGLRRLLHLSKHDYLENKLHKDQKSQLEQEIGELQTRLEDMKRQLSDLEEDRYDDFGTRFDIDRFLISGNATGTGARGCGTGTGQSSMISPKPSMESMNNNMTNHRPYVFKKQQEALKQLMEDLPNKSDVVINQIEYASDKVVGSAVDNMKRFHKNRKRPKTVNNISIPAVYALKLPPAMSALPSGASATGGEQHQHQQQDGLDPPSDGNNLVVSGVYPGMQGLYSGVANELYLNHLGGHGNPLVCLSAGHSNANVLMVNHGHGGSSGQNNSAAITTGNNINNNNSGVHMEQCDNTNDSLRSFLIDITGCESHNGSQLTHDSLFNTFINDAILQPICKREDINIGMCCTDSESGSLSRFLNACVKADK